jgi:hypothetical protein
MTKTQVLILWGLAAVVVVVFAVLSQFIARSPDADVAVTVPPAQVYSLPAVPHSARGYYPRADQAARTWQGDALLVSATASWSFARIDALDDPVDWTFQFYSPGTRQLYVVNVGETAVASIMSTLSPYELPTVSIDRWRLDSYEALSTWLNHGGANFLNRYSVVDVSARLRHAEDGRLEWSVVGMVGDSQTFHLVRIDVASGEVID